MFWYNDIIYMSYRPYVQIPFSSFTLTWRGFVKGSLLINSSAIDTIGITLADRTAGIYHRRVNPVDLFTGPYSLEIDNIQAVNSSAILEQNPAENFLFVDSYEDRLEDTEKENQQRRKHQQEQTQSQSQEQK